MEDVYLATLGTGYWFLLSAVFLFVILYQLLVSNFTWKRIQWLQSFKYKNQLASGLFICFMLSHLVHIWADATLNQDIAKQSALFPGSYPLTAKTLLARHGLIDLEQYELSKSKQAMVNSGPFQLAETEPTHCQFNGMPDLQISLVANDDYESVKTWLEENHFAFQQSKQLNLASDLNTTLFNFESGLPGLYQYSETPESSYINHQIGADKIRIQISSSPFDVSQAVSNPSDKRVFVFYQQRPDSQFYRTNALLVGFPKLDDIPINPQNIVAAYIQHGLNCPEYISNNLVDQSYQSLSSEDVLTNYANGYLHLIYKDNSILFKNGQLISNQTFSTQKSVDEPISIHIVQKAIKTITDKKAKK